MVESKFVNFLMSILKQQANSFTGFSSFFSVSDFAWLFSVIKNNSSVLFWVKSYRLCTKGTNQSAYFLEFLVFESKFTKFLAFLKQKISFSSNFAPLFSTMRHNFSVPFQLKCSMLLTKGAYQSANLVKFHLSSWKSEILHFGVLHL